MPITPDDFRAALSRFAGGVTVVTTKDAGGRIHGITVSAFSSVSLEPPLVLICIEKAAGSHYAFGESGVFAVNILSSSQADISERFASQLADKFEGVDLDHNGDGIPLIQGCLANLECHLVDTLDGGDHSIFLGRVKHAALYEGDPLIYFRSGYHAVGERLEVQVLPHESSL